MEFIYDIEDVEEICSEAFFESSVRTFYWPQKVTVIPNSCFEACSKLSNVVGIEKVTDVGKKAFAETVFQCFYWPEKCGVIPDSCFYGCSYLEEISVPKSVSSIGVGAFQECKRLREFIWPESCTLVPANCFCDCQSLRNVEFPKFTMAIRISENAFVGTSLEEVDLSDMILCEAKLNSFSESTKVVYPFYSNLFSISE
jgi:hypothetical protein